MAAFFLPRKISGKLASQKTGNQEGGVMPYPSVLCSPGAAAWYSSRGTDVKLLRHNVQFIQGNVAAARSARLKEV